MLQLDATILSSKASAIFSLSGWGLPALDWTKRANQQAKALLDDVEDDALFAPQQVKDEAMAAAVRALMYLWTGWPDHTSMLAGALPEKERLYTLGLAYRQMNKIDESKTQFQQLTERPFDEELAEVTAELISDHAEAPLKRFRDLIQLGQAWEPFAYTDLFLQAKDGSLSMRGEEVVRKLQWQEFNLLMQRCYLAATGVDITKREAAVVSRQVEPAWKRNMPAKKIQPIAQSPQAPAGKAGKKEKEKNGKSKDAAAKESAQAEPSAAPAKPKEPENARLKCPKCGNVAVYSKSFRGKKVACLKCRTAFQYAA